MTNHTDLLRRALSMIELGMIDYIYQGKGEDVYRLVVDLRTAIETDGWLPIDDKAKDGTFWLCLHKSGHRNIMQFCHAGYWRTGLSDHSKRIPIGYMPLPPPPNSPNRESE